MKTRTLLKTCILAVLLWTHANAKIIYVDDNGPADFNNIQAAIDDANDGDTVLVADGTYSGDGNRDIDFNGKAITVKSENGPETCIIDCQGTFSEPHRGFYFHGEGTDSIVDGFTITNGYTDGVASGIRIQSSLFKPNCPTIQNCIIIHNYNGDAITCSDCHPKIVNCVISNNGGNGFSCYQECNAQLINCLISENKGHGVQCSDGVPKIINCTIVDNGENGIYCDYFNGTPEIVNCIIWNNSLYNCPLPLYSCWPEGTSGIGNMNTYPEFVNPAEGNYRLKPYSVCIDSGTNNTSIQLPSLDIDGNSRTIDGDKNGSSIIDMGVYETILNQEPVIGLSNNSVNFVAEANDTDIEDQILSIHNRGGNTLNWAITYDCNWLNVFPTAGSSIDEVNEVTLRVDTTGLTSGIYTCTLTFFDDIAINSPETVIVSLHLSAEKVYVPEQFSTIQDAIDHVLEGDTIIITDGIYTGMDNHDLDFMGKAITVRSENGPDNCIIDCQGSESDLHRGFYFHNSEDENSILEGFTISNGYTLDRGAGITCENRSSPTIRNCIITNNYSGENTDYSREQKQSDYNAGSGGIFCTENSNPIIDNCIITNNTADGYSWNPWGGGISSVKSKPTISNCIISGNKTSSIGGGIIADRCDEVLITDCVIIGNTASSGGGIYSNYTDMIIENCFITNNNASSGGGMSSSRCTTRLYNCIITNNNAESGGGVGCSQCIQLLTNCTIANNQANLKGGGIALGHGGYGGDIARLENCILWGNTAEQGNQVSLSDCMSIIGCMGIDINYSCIETGPNAGYWAGRYEWQLETGNSGNIDTDPFFANPGYWADANDPNIIAEPNEPYAVWIEGDYHLKSQAGRWDPSTQNWIQDDVTSPCIDAGDPNSPVGYEPFPNGGYVNMGAYGGTSEASKSYFGEPLCETIIAGDINGDCKVDQADLDILMLHWLEEQ